MACSNCKKQKQLKINSTAVTLIKTSSIYLQSDFVLGYWQGDNETEFIGTNTGINYGMKNYAQQLVVHKSDLPDERIEVLL